MDPINEPLRVVPPDAGPWSVVVESDNNNGFMTKTLYKIASISYYDIDRSSCKMLTLILWKTKLVYNCHWNYQRSNSHEKQIPI